MDETRNLPLVQDIILDMTESQLPVVYANQYDDSGRTVNCHMQDQGVDFDCTGYTVELFVKKSNGYGLTKIIGFEDFGSISNNIISFAITKDMTFVHGRQECRLAFIYADKIIYSCNFYLRVNEAFIKQEDIFDSDDYKTVHDEYLLFNDELEKKSELSFSKISVNDVVITAKSKEDILTLSAQNNVKISADDSNNKVIISFDKSDLVPTTRTIAGINLANNISKSKLQQALSVPSKTSELENDSNYITIDDVPEFSKSDTKPNTPSMLGDIVYNSYPISGDYIGWVYTPSGWFGFGKIEFSSNSIELSDGSAFILSDGTLFLTADE